MEATIKRNARVAAGGFGEATNDITKDTRATTDAQAGKWLAMFLYNAGACSLSDTAIAFARHPEWVRA